MSHLAYTLTVQATKGNKMTCTLCNNPASFIGWAGDPETHAEQIAVCGSHSLDGDVRI